MSLPEGIETCTVTAGAPVTFGGALVKTYVSIEPSVYLVHTATGTPLVDFLEEQTVSEGVAAQFSLPVDQDGFQDENGNAYRGWFYTARTTYSTMSKAKSKAPKVKVFQLAAGQTLVDLDLLPGGTPALPYTAPLATVTSVNGATGAVVVAPEPLPARLEEAALNATFALKGEAEPTYATSAWTAGSEALPLAADKTRIFGLGSSSMGNMRTEIEDALAGQAWGATYTSWAEAGERFEHALARAGIIPARLTFPSNTIPASGAVTVTTDLPTGNFMRAYTGTVAGVPGVLSLSSPVFTFTRTTAGAAVPTTAGAEFVPSAIGADLGPALPAFRDAVAILDTGKNNTGDAGAADRINAALDLLVDWLVPRVKTFVVLGQFADTNSTLTQKQNVAKVNAYRAAKYGALFIDLHAYVTGSQIWTDAGITPTATDLNQQAKGEKPGSLSSDDLHLNAAAELAVVNKLIMPKLAAALGRVLYGPSPVVISDSFSGPNMTNLSGRVTDSALGGEAFAWTADANFGTVTGNQVVTGTNTSMIALPAQSANVEFTVKVTTVPTASSMNVMVRASSTAADINNNAYRATLSAGGGLILGRRNAGSTVTISTGSYTVTAGDRFGVKAHGTQISLMKNGVALETVTDSAVTNGAWAGISVVGTTGAAFDDVIYRRIDG